MHSACDVSAACQPRVVQLEMEAARRDLRNETVKPVDAPLNVWLASPDDLDRRAVWARQRAVRAVAAKCVGERALRAAGARYDVGGNLKFEAGASRGRVRV
jgi:hypothetical protein